MSPPDAGESFEVYRDRLARRESRAMRRTILYTLVPVLLTIVLLWVSARRVLEARDEVDRAEDDVASLRATKEELAAERARLEDRTEEMNLRIDGLKLSIRKGEQEVGRLREEMRETVRRKEEELERLHVEAKRRQARIERLETELEVASARLAESVRLERFVHPFSWSDLKAVHVRNGEPAGSILGVIHRLREASWRVGGRSVEEGFDSVTFARHVLKTLDLARDIRDLKPVAAPRPGDVVRYPSGYALFYFLDVDGKPFVLGMTPFGVASLRFDFDEPTGFLRPRS